MQNLAEALKEARKIGESSGLKEYHAKTAPHIAYVDWLEARLVLMTQLLEKVVKEHRIDRA